MLRIALVLGTCGLGSSRMIFPGIESKMPQLEELKKLVEKQNAGLESFVAAEQNELFEPTICDPSVKQHSGYLDAGNKTKYFFWMFESRTKPSSDPLLIWLQGGPGCSSIDGLLTENGPCHVNKEGTDTIHNPYSWNEKANVLWVDQPQSTGFSHGPLEISPNSDKTAEHFIIFLANFYKAFPQYKKNDLYLSGESYGGHWVPAFAHRLWQEGPEAAPLKGVLVGNGLVDAEEQYKWYAEQAYDGGKKEGGTLKKGVVTTPWGQGVMKASLPLCEAAIRKCNNDNTTTPGVQSAACIGTIFPCDAGVMGPYENTNMSPYDMRKKCEEPPLCMPEDNVIKYMHNPDVLRHLGASQQQDGNFPCSNNVNMMFFNDMYKNYQTKFVDLLNSGIRVMIYAGDADFICNWLGCKHWTLKLEWPHKDSFNAAEDKPYMFADGRRQLGRIRHANGLSYTQIYQAGHLVPMDQPEAALTMLNDFLANKNTGEESVVV